MNENKRSECFITVPLTLGSSIARHTQTLHLIGPLHTANGKTDNKTKQTTSFTLRMRHAGISSTEINSYCWLKTKKSRKKLAQANQQQKN